MSAELGNYISGGYFIAKPADRDAGRSEGLLPDKLLSFSTCIGPHLPDDWMFDWMKGKQGYDLEGRLQDAAEYGLAPDQARAAIAWTTQHYPEDVAHSGSFYTLETARDFAAKFLPYNNELAIYGLGLHQSLAHDFLQNGKPPDCQDIDDIKHTTDGVYHSIQLGGSVEDGSEALGFDLLVFDPYTYALGCSWLCNGLEREFKEKLGIIPNCLGLIDDFENALKCADLIVRENIPAEPGLWLPWLIARYSRSAGL